MTTKQISVFLENRPGALAAFCKVLEKHNIDMRAMCLADAMDFGILRIIVDDTFTTMTTLKDEGYVCQVTKVLTIEIDDKPGALVGLLTALGDENVNLEYSYAFLSRKEDKAYMILKLDNMAKAKEVLVKLGTRIVCQDEMEQIFGD